MSKTKNEIVDKLIAEIVDLRLGQIDAKAIRSTDSIVIDLAIDSLDYASLLFSCEEWLNARVDENTVNWAEVSTIDDLADLLFKSQE